ncbi:MAG: histidine ammonia-lyase [Cytophagales bacterium]|nr:MAG: histidine ammonia-lyase [Cytophagales bacterium]
MQKIVLDGKNLTIEQVSAVAFSFAPISIAPTALEAVEKSFQFIQTKVAENAIIYGVTTGFGSNVDKFISQETALALQVNLIRSHATGVGAPFDTAIVRAIMLIRLNTLLQGLSGVQTATIRLLEHFLNLQIHPVIPSQGSVGASGDLCPLAHMALALIGEGDAEHKGRVAPSSEWLQKHALQALQPLHKEGLALLNGTTVMNAIAALACFRAEKLFKLATMQTAMAAEALCARKQAFDKKIHEVRRHEGQLTVAHLIQDYTEGSHFLGIAPLQIWQSASSLFSHFSPEEKEDITHHLSKSLKIAENLIDSTPNELSTAEYLRKRTCLRFINKKLIPQDAYSIRCAPQVIGASWQALIHIKQIISQELNAVVDNPIIFIEEDEILSGGNFHGQPLALAADYLKIALAEVGNLLERQTNKLLDPATNDYLPAMLIENAGLHSGLMIPQYAAAALVSENKVLAHPASVDSIPTCANQEDHVSMGTIACRQAYEILHNVEKIVAIALMTSTQAMDIRQKQLTDWGFTFLEWGKKTSAMRQTIRQLVSFLEEDRFLKKDIDQLLNHWQSLVEGCE